MQADTSPVHDASMFTVVPWQPRHTLHGLEVTKQQDWHAPVSAQQPSLPGTSVVAYVGELPTTGDGLFKRERRSSHGQGRSHGQQSDDGEDLHAVAHTVHRQLSAALSAECTLWEVGSCVSSGFSCLGVACEGNESGGVAKQAQRRSQRIISRRRVSTQS